MPANISNTFHQTIIPYVITLNVCSEKLLSHSWNKNHDMYINTSLLYNTEIC